MSYALIHCDLHKCSKVFIDEYILKLAYYDTKNTIGLKTLLAGNIVGKHAVFK